MEKMEVLPVRFSIYKFFLLYINFALFVFCPSILIGSSEVNIELVSDKKEVSIGDSFELALHFQVEKDWYLYWINPGSIGAPTKINWKLPPGVFLEEVRWPSPEKKELFDSLNFIYNNQAIALVKGQLSNEFQEDSLEIQANIDWSACSSNQCKRGITNLNLSLNKGESTPVSPSVRSLFQEAKKTVSRNNWKGSIKLVKADHALYFEFPYQVDINNAYFFPDNSTWMSFEKNQAFQQVKSGNYLLKVPLLKGAPDRVRGILSLKSGEQRVSFKIDMPLKLADSFAEATYTHYSIWWIIVMAFLGGVLLNIMPCVLPVISLKLITLLDLLTASRKSIFYYCLSFVSGIFVSFWTLTILLIILKKAGESIGWGFQFQEPLFIIFLSLFLLIFSLSLFGVFEIGIRFNQLGKPKSPSIWGSFFSGFLATIVSTPCTGPFLGTVLGFGLTLSSLQIMGVFSAIAFGFSLPYLLFGFFPRVLKLFPKPGAWMLSFKQFMGFLLLGSVIWLLWVYIDLVGSESFLWIGLYFLLTCFTFWIYGKWGSLKTKRWKRNSVNCICLMLLFFNVLGIHFKTKECTQVVKKMILFG